jgi:lupus La protein
LYAGPFPFDTSLDEIVNFFEGVSKINSVRMRRHVNSKDFKGSVFVEFCTPEEAQRVQTTLNLEFQGAPLVLEPKLDYMKRKEEERHARPNSPYTEGKIDAENFKSTDKGEGREGRDEISTEQAAGEDTAIENYEPGCLLKFDFGEDVEFGDPVTFGLVKDSFGGKGKGMEYVEYTAGEKSGIARFSSPTAAQEALAECEDGKRLIAGYPATLTLMQGDEEKTYMQRVLRAKAAAEGQRVRQGQPSKKGGPQRGRKRRWM